MADQDRYAYPDRNRGGGRDVYMDNRTGIGAQGRGYRAQWREEDRDTRRYGDREETYNQRRGENASFREDDYGQADGGRTGYRAYDDETRYGGGYRADWDRGRHEDYGGGRYAQGRSRYATGDDQTREREHRGWLDYAARSNPDFYADKYGAAGPGWAEEYRGDYRRARERYGSGYRGDMTARSYEADYGERDRHPGDGRGFWDKAADKVASWFGGEESRGEGYEADYRGRGPKGYRRSDERIREDVCDCLSDDAWLDASEIEVKVENCDVTLSGEVRNRDDKRRAEHLVERISGVDNVQNNLRVERSDSYAASGSNVPVKGSSTTTIPGGTSATGELGVAGRKTTQ